MNVVRNENRRSSASAPERAAVGHKPLPASPAAAAAAPERPRQTKDRRVPARAHGSHAASPPTGRVPSAGGCSPARQRPKLRTRKDLANALCVLAFAVLAAIVLFPVVYMAANCFMAPAEVTRYYQTIYSETGPGAVLHLIPDLFSLQSIYQVFLRRPDYLMKFWNSLLLAAAAVGGQVVVSCMGGFAFAKFRFRGKGLLFFFLVILMMMPVQVTLVPNYVILDKLGLLGGWAALALPAVFSPFGTVLMTQIFRGIPDEILDAARLDGANTGQLLARVLAPAAKGGVVSLVLLSFIDV